MRNLLFILAAICFMACSTEYETEKESNYSIESANLAFEIATKISNKQTVTDAEWDSLMASSGYQAYFCIGKKIPRNNFLKNAFEVAFDESQKHTLDSILNEPFKLSPQMRYNFMVLNLNNYKERQKEVQAFAANTDFSMILEKAKKLAQSYVPEEIRESEVALHKVNFVLIEPNAYVNNCGLVVDIHNAYNMGEEELIKLLAHEFHHNYRGINHSISDHVLFRKIDQLQLEGIADLIDKEIPPLDKIGIYPQSIVDTHNELFANTPQILQQLDSLTYAYIAGEIDEKSYTEHMNSFFLDGGHANGQYMSLKIKAAGLTDQLIANYNDPVSFIKLYNEAVANAPSEYQFSATFIDYIEELKREHLESNVVTSEEEFKVTFRVEVPSPSDEVFITGNKAALGDWNPDQVKLNKKDASLIREIKVQINSPAAFKFTRGSWGTEGITNDFGRSQNLKLKFEKDTVVNYKIYNWSDSNI
ncbi:DUF5700 domain-containing putative Zn-dependent protease [Sediminitomix flava]|nr:DUF5700 domain-containing putative Zn-dependent protease [Sediminitomix flava]